MPQHSSRPIRARLRPAALAVHLALGGLLGASALSAAAQTQAVRSYAIPAGPLGPALSAFAADAGVLLAFDPALTGGKNTAGLNGSYGVEDGLRRLLQGSGLQLAPQKDGGYRLLPVRAADAGTTENTLAAVVVQASADASAAGLTKAYAGGQVARGGRVGLLGNQDMMDTPFSSTAYTSQLIQDQQAKSVADVVQNDPTVRVARGFGNFQELYMMRGFPVPSDDMTYNGLYGVLPRQFVAAELLERVEVFRGASSFINGGVGVASGFGVGGTVNALPKRAPAEALTQVTAGIEQGGQYLLATDLARRIGPDERIGLRFNAARRQGESSVEHEDRDLDVLALGADYRGDRFRLSADLGYQYQHIDTPRPSVTPAGGIPSAPDGKTNFGQKWTYAEDRQTFATLRGEVDLSEAVSAWAAAGFRHGKEKNVLTNLSADGSGKTSAYRFDNVREDDVKTGEVGIRGKFASGPVSHAVVLSAAAFASESRTAFAMGDWNAPYAGNLYHPFPVAIPAPTYLTGGNMHSPRVTERIDTSSVALADTLGFFEDRLLLTVGARRQNIVQKGYNATTGIRETDYDESDTTPMAGLVYKLTPQISLYGNYIEGLTKGDVAPNTALNPMQALAPYVSKQKEIGIKYDGGRIGAGLSLFSVEKPFGMLVNNYFTDGGEQRNRGIELSAFGEPLRGTRLLGGVTLVQAEVTKSNDPAQVDQRAIGTPKTQANVGIEWDVPGVPGLTLTGRTVYTSAQYADAANNQRVPSWTRLDLGARYLTSFGDRMLTIRARLDNATDRDYWASAGGYPGYGYLVLGTPRTFTLSATVDF